MEIKRRELFSPILLCALTIIVLNPCDGADNTDIIRCRTDILNNYDVHSRPTLQHKMSTFVDVYFYNSGIEFVNEPCLHDERSGFFTLHALVYFEWHDEHVKWNPANYGNLSELTFFPTELWRPDIMVYNNLDKSEMDHYFNTLIMATSNGTLYWVPPAKFQVACVTDYYRWPYDLQQCTIELGSWSYDGSEVYFSVSENHTQMDDASSWMGPLQNREWDLINNQIRRIVVEYPCCPGVPFITVEITSTIQRRSSVHTAVVVIIAFGIATAILTSFWLNPNAKERLPVILASLIINILYLNQIYGTIPQNGNRTPWTICYFRDSLIMIQFALAWTVLLRYISKSKRDSQVPLPSWVTSFLEGCVAKILCLNPRPTIADNSAPRNTGGSGGEFDDGDELMKQETFFKEDWGWFANLLDRVAFVFYLFVYACFILTF